MFPLEKGQDVLREWTWADTMVCFTLAESHMQKLAQDNIEQELAALPEWSLIADDAIQRTFGFEDFADAMAFVNKVADLAEQSQHHPDILIRYNKVTLTLSTHSAGGLTEKDFDLAERVDALVE